MRLDLELILIHLLIFRSCLSTLCQVVAPPLGEDGDPSVYPRHGKQPGEQVEEMFEGCSWHWFFLDDVA